VTEPVTIRIEQTPNGWAASIPQMPGAITSGATVSDALRNLADALENVSGEIYRRAVAAREGR